jgi:tRNA(fMet)-specific endonuclease VapC
VGKRDGRAAQGSHRRGPILTLLLLDTTVLIDAERSARELDALIADEDQPAIAAITVAELAVGVEVATGRRRRARQEFLDDVVASVPILDYDLDVARAHGHLLVAVRTSGRPRGAHDLIIAATARATARTVAAADYGAFLGLPGVIVREPT